MVGVAGRLCRFEEVEVEEEVRAGVSGEEASLAPDFGVRDSGRSGHVSRHLRAKLGPTQSRMQTARATVSRGKLAFASIDWTIWTEAVANEADEGMRLTRWIAGPGYERCRVSAWQLRQNGEMAIAIANTEPYLDRLHEENSRVHHIEDSGMASCESRVSLEAV